MRVLGQLDVSSLRSNSELDRVGYQDELIIELVLLCSVIYPPTACHESSDSQTTV
jgi:hypothetical protein